MTVEDINKAIQELPDNKAGKISDGYHTFDELYDHRITLFIALCHALEGYHKFWKTYLHSDGTKWDGWFIAGITFDEGGQITYHIPEDRWEELDVPEIAKAPEYDGHTPKDVIDRIKKYLY